MNRHESAKMPWKILNHPDKLYGEVTTRQMTEEERQKYGEANQNTKKMMGEEEYMKSLGISTEQLIEDCKKHGTGWVSAKTIAEKYDNVTQKQIYGLIKNRKIKTILEVQNDVKECTEHKDCEVTQHKGYKEHKPRLKPTGLTSQNINGLVYKLFSESLVISASMGTAKIGIDYREIDELIKDLQEIKIIARGVKQTDEKR